MSQRCRDCDNCMRIDKVKKYYDCVTYTPKGKDRCIEMPLKYLCMFNSCPKFVNRRYYCKALWRLPI